MGFAPPSLTGSGTNVALGIGTVTPDRTDPRPLSATIRLTVFLVGAADPVWSMIVTSTRTFMFDAGASATGTGTSFTTFGAVTFGACAFNAGGGSGGSGGGGGG